MAYTTASPAGASVAKPATAQSAIEDFDPVLARLETLANRASNCGDRIVGSRPAEVAGTKDAPEPNHLICAIQARRERLVRVVDHLENEIGRIENGLA